jgi:2-polyprenyl-6-methoxyphenol hydroxylase-like FAD-dependent oxidoreductase
MADRDYDVAIVGASLAGCAAAISFGRAGLRVALVEKRPDPKAYKQICTHYIQASAIASLERLGLLEPMMKAGAVRSRARLHSQWGWIEPPSRSRVPAGVNLRRELLDPLIRQTAAETPGVDLMLGMAACELLREDVRPEGLRAGTTRLRARDCGRSAVAGVKARAPDGRTLAVRARLTVGADGRGSRVAKLAGVPSKTVRHGRFAYGGYFDGPPPEGAPDASLWFLDPDMAAAFPTDGGLTFYACMPTMDRLDAFRGDPAGALVDMLAAIPDPPPIRASRLVGEVQGKLDMTNIAHAPAAPGLALVGDAALAIDPLWGIGCGWALQSSEWLTDSVLPALHGREPLARGLRRYRRAHARRLNGHARMIYGYAGGRRMDGGERAIFWAAARDEGVARAMEAYATRMVGPARMFATVVPRTALVSARHRLSRRRSGGSGPRRAQAQAGEA